MSSIARSSKPKFHHDSGARPNEEVGRGPLSTSFRNAPKIAINGRFLTQKLVGVQRFATETTKALDRLLGDPAYAALRGNIEIVAPRAAQAFDLEYIPVRRCGFLRGYAWEQIEFPLHSAGSLRLNLCILGPVAVRRQIVVFHDATVRAMPDTFSWKFRAVYNTLMPMLMRSDCVAAVSDFSRHEIGKYYGADIARMPVCHEGGDHILAAPADRSVLERIGAAGRPYFLGVGVFSSNKNMKLALDAFLQSGLDDTLLVLTGSPDPHSAIYSAVVSDKRVRLAGYVTDAQLRALYENALALVFPSTYEGFGLPPLEAMQAGCPVVISPQPALVEVGGNAVLKCAMHDVAGLTDLMRQLHGDATLRARLKTAGLERAGRFTWKRTAQTLLDLCLEVAASRRA